MNKNTPFKMFHSKILLFGEHLINLGCDALTIPYPTFSGALSSQENSDDRLEQYLDFLSAKEFKFLDEAKLRARPRLIFDSNIPEGYGAGSSGAIVAACYDYFKSEGSTSHQELKKYFSAMEAYFHGISSGTDPLVSYLNQVIKFNANGDINILDSIYYDLSDYNLVLIDSGNARSGKKYINWFMENSAKEDFKHKLTETLIPATLSCIKYLSGHKDVDFVSAFHQISQFQHDHMEMMIPDHIKPIWSKGLDAENYFLKICGAGGGGFFIALVRKDKTELLSSNLRTYSLI